MSVCVCVWNWFEKEREIEREETDFKFLSFNKYLKKVREKKKCKSSLGQKQQSGRRTFLLLLYIIDWIFRINKKINKNRIEREREIEKKYIYIYSKSVLWLFQVR